MSSFDFSNHKAKFMNFGVDFHKPKVFSISAAGAGVPGLYLRSLAVQRRDRALFSSTDNPNAA